MGYTNQTTYLGLPQWVDNDKPSFLVDMNNAFSKIDENAQQQGNDGTQNTTNIEALQKSDTSQNERLTNLENKQRDLDTDITQLNEDVNQLDNFTGIEIPLQTEAQTLSGAVNEIHTGAVPSTNINELIEQIGVKYEGVTAKLLVFSNGEWVNYGEQNVNNNLLYDNGSFLNNGTINPHTNIPVNLNWSNIAGGVRIYGGPTINQSTIQFNLPAQNTSSATYSYVAGAFSVPVSLNDYNGLLLYLNINNLKNAIKADRYENPEIISGFTSGLNTTESLTPFNRVPQAATGLTTINYSVSSLTGEKFFSVYAGSFQLSINQSSVSGKKYQSGSIDASILSVEFKS